MINPALILGKGCTRVGEHWGQSIYDLATEAVHAAMADACVEDIDILVVGNMLSGVLNRQENLGACLVERTGLGGIEAIKAEAACASGAAAIRVGAALVANRCCRHAVVVGVEKMTDARPAAVAEGLAYAADFEVETLLGASFPALAALLTSIYLQRTEATSASLSAFPLNAHRQAVTNQWAMFSHAITIEEWSQSPIVAEPLRLLDCPPICDGAAAVVLGATKAVDNPHRVPIEIAAIEGATDTVALAQRKNPLRLSAAERSASKALAASGIALTDLDLFEPHDAFPVLAALSLEAVGISPRQQGWRYLKPGGIFSKKQIPIQTMGGLQGRGHPVGATAVYQIIEACTQLWGEAEQNQIPGATTAMIQSFGGLASNAYTTILRQHRL